MSEEEYLARFVRLLITLEEECDTPSIGVMMKRVLSESIIAEKNTDYLSLHKFVTQYDMALQEDSEDEEFHIIVDELFTDEELKAIIEGGVEE